MMHSSNPETEVWRDIIGVDGYEVSNLGRVRSKDRVVTGEGGKTFNFKARLVQWVYVGKERRQVAVAVTPPGQKRQTLSVKRAVYEAFIGLLPKGAIIKNLNGDEFDLRAANLYHKVGS